MRPRNVLTETNDIRKMMGLPLLNEDTGDSVKDIKNKVLNENSPAGFSLGMARQGGLTIDEEEVSETTEAEDFRDEDVADDPEATEEQEDEGFEDGDVIGVYSNIKKQRKLKETNKGSFAQYDITEGWFGGDEKKKDELEGYEPLTGLAELKDEARRIISFLTPGEGDEIEGKYMKEVYPAMALQVAQSLYSKIEKMM